MVKWNMKLMYNYCKEHNYDLPKDNQTYTNLHNKYIYVCPKHGEYLQEWNKHRYGHGCPKCGGVYRKNMQDYIGECKQLGIDLPIEKYVNSITPIKHKCSKCGKVYEQTPNNHLRGQGCPYCSGMIKKYDKEYYKQQCKELGLDLPVEEYINTNTKIKHKCNRCGKIYLQTPKFHLLGYGCLYCSGMIKKYNKDYYIQQCKELGVDLPIEQYVDNKTKIKHKCNKCGNIYLQTPKEHVGVQRQGCPICGLDKKVQNNNGLTGRKTIEKYSKECKQKGYDLPISGETYVNNKTYIKHRCKQCDKIYEQTPNAHLLGIGCPYCSQSHGEKFIQNYLDNHSISYITQKKFNNLKDKRLLSYDFYLPKQKVLIEYQGIQHFEKGGGYMDRQGRLQKQQYHDKLKRDYATNNGYILLEPTYKLNSQEKVNNYLDKHLIN